MLFPVCSSNTVRKSFCWVKKNEMSFFPKYLLRGELWGEIFHLNSVFSIRGEPGPMEAWDDQNGILRRGSCTMTTSKLKLPSDYVGTAGQQKRGGPGCFSVSSALCRG